MTSSNLLINPTNNLNQNSQSVFSQYQRQQLALEQLMMQTSNRSKNGRSSGDQLTHQQLVTAKKRQTNIPGYSGIKSDQKIRNFLGRGKITRNTQSVMTKTPAGELNSS